MLTQNKALVYFDTKTLSELTMPAPYEIESLGGNCPVQAEGRIGAKRFYFRARWDSWSVSVFERDEDFLTPEWYYEEPYVELGSDAAGWMEEDVARTFLIKALNLYLEA